MYSHVDYRGHKTVLNPAKIIKTLIFSTLIFSTYVFAGAAEDRTNSVINTAINSKYSSATGKDYTVGNVVVKDGILSADIKQKVIVDGSSATVGTKVSIPANDAFYKQSAKYAKGLLKSSAYAYAASVGMETLLRGVDYVMGEGGVINKKPVDDGSIQPWVQYAWCSTSSSRIDSTCRSTAEAACRAQGWISYTFVRVEGQSCYGRDNSTGKVLVVTGVKTIKNPQFDSTATNTPKPATDAEIDDAFTNWFRNNPTSVTDPVNTYIYSGKSSNGTPVTQPQSPPSFGQNTITDEMMDNYLANRDAQLRSANDQARREAIHSDSTKESPDTTPKTSTKTETLPDGSTRKTDTKTETLPDGSTKTTETVTTTKPDGSTSTTTSEQVTSPVAEKSIPPACEYFAILCDWLNWTKENPDIPDDSELPTIQNIEVGQLDTNTFKATPGCPAPILAPVSFGTGGTVEISYEPICQFATKWSLVAPLIGFFSGAMIIVGLGRKGGDSDS
ncbi:hypothetical protein D9K79_17895 [Acinetobacter cumulans]|uniref:TspB protein n=1 Tax=Acinetobacter cumulans TaxID=2136182 RepID=A0ABX9U250_9GAMM|nr:virulence factor TspB C-terminal domain-related protein [Acinetobacter cumulans]RLL36410.1 hypothetical protein D9K79_17895 [Acinetobacter cumulans]